MIVELLYVVSDVAATMLNFQFVIIFTLCIVGLNVGVHSSGISIVLQYRNIDIYEYKCIIPVDYSTMAPFRLPLIPRWL